MKFGKIMRLDDFFGRFDFARDKLMDLVTYEFHDSCGDREEISSDNQRAFALLCGGFCVDLQGENFSYRKRFQKRKGDVVVFGDWCYVPKDLVRDIDFAEGAWKKYSSGNQVGWEYFPELGRFVHGFT